MSDIYYVDIWVSNHRLEINIKTNPRNFMVLALFSVFLFFVPLVADVKSPLVYTLVEDTTAWVTTVGIVDTQNITVNQIIMVDGTMLESKVDIAWFTIMVDT